MTICSPSFTPERIWAIVTLLYTNLDFAFVRHHIGATTITTVSPSAFAEAPLVESRGVFDGLGDRR